MLRGNGLILGECVIKYCCLQCVVRCLIQGLEYLHETSLKVHGQLKSSNIVIDNRWTCKLTDFGMVQFCDGEEPDPEQSDYAKYASKLSNR